MNTSRISALIQEVFGEALHAGAKHVTIAIRLGNGLTLYFRCNDRWRAKDWLVGPDGAAIGLEQELPIHTTSREDFLEERVARLEAELEASHASAREDFDDANSWRQYRAQVEEARL